VRDVEIDVRANPLQSQIEQSGGCGAVNVIIAIDGDLFPSADGRQYPLHGLFHIRKEEWVVLLRQLGMEKVRDLVHCFQIFPVQQFRYNFGTLQLTREAFHLLLVFRSQRLRQHPLFFHSSPVN